MWIIASFTSTKEHLATFPSGYEELVELSNPWKFGIAFVEIFPPWVNVFLGSNGNCAMFGINALQFLNIENIRHIVGL